MKTASLFCLLFVRVLVCFGQDHESFLARQLSRQDRYEYFLDKSKKQKTQAIIAVTAGPVLTVIGAYIASKGGPTITGSSGGYLTIGNNDTKGVIGTSIGAFGVLTTLSSIPLFIASSKNKKQAALLLKDQPTSFLNRIIRVPSLTLKLSL